MHKTKRALFLCLWGRAAGTDRKREAKQMLSRHRLQNTKISNIHIHKVIWLYFHFHYSLDLTIAFDIQFSQKQTQHTHTLARAQENVVSPIWIERWVAAM